ncbi:PP2C family protein-serine/threonine phosphatase [Sphingomonas sp. PAMC 26605]|uniref:PP2C family protein-serine/threonine phosphatase n=1 Tax=Sphingomonas sp. PAMC 26605 TaxID=1112214 RepID=UPI00026CA740|nr:protein phosphatase 2C domain-containing protein [Sphingomonas sp. PAMC 26605]
MTHFRVRLGGDAITGARDEQQDAFSAGLALLSNGHSAKLAVLVDGMGGHVGGAIAARVAIGAFLRAAESGRWPTFAETLRASLDIANDAIATQVEQEPRYRGMGCTLVAAIFDDDSLWMISVGDSLLLRVGPSALERLNADHSMAPLIEGAAALDGESPQRHLLRSALTGGPIALIDERRYPQAGETRILLASDGLLTLTPATILQTLLETSRLDPERQAKALLAAVEAQASPDQDNCTIIVVECSNPASRPRRVRPVIGGLLLVGGAVSLGYAGWSIVTAPERTAMRMRARSPATVTPTAPAVRREGYPRARDAVAPISATTIPTSAATVAAPIAPGRKPAKPPQSPRIPLDLQAFLGDDSVAAPQAAAPVNRVESAASPGVKALPLQTTPSPSPSALPPPPAPSGAAQARPAKDHDK